ncbi:chorismate mutase [Bacillus sp. 2205SS5-2]|uniref:chorismate mutase n=1 Tax=Bacillus sp. 2205SS5-2 TaxID=3109031 RepID=UPI0030041515
MIRGIRGAITVEEDQATSVLEATSALLTRMIESNNLLADDVASVFISVTKDLNSTFPAKALRTLPGWSFVPVMCMQEVPVLGSIEKCIRVMIHVNSLSNQADIVHIYLKRAVELRPDLNQSNS